MVLEMVMESLFAVVDIFFVSQLGSEDAIATIGLTESVLFITMALALGLETAAIAMVSRRTGEGKYEAASLAGAQTILLTVAIGIGLGVIGFFYADDLLRLLGGSPSLVEEGTTYARIILSLNIIVLLLFVNNGILRGSGDAALAMRTLWLANGINIILDPCLILGLGPFPAMGLTGAAIATCIGRGIGILYQLYHLFNGKSIIKLTIAHFRLQWNTMVNLIKLAIGGAGQHLLTSASWIFLVRIIATFGSEALAGYTIAIRIVMFTLLPSWGLSLAASTLVGQNLGANLPDRAEKSAWKAALLNMIFLACIAIMSFVIARPVIGLFSDNAEVIRNGVLALQIICAGYIFYAYEMVIGQSFNGAGDTYTPTVLNFICFWLIQIPLGYLLAITWGWGPTGVYIAIAFASSILAILAIYIFRKGKWKHMKV